MSDYYNLAQVSQICGIAESTITQLQSKGLLDTTVKRGMQFFPSQQVYRLRVAVEHANKEKIDLQEALAKVEERWLTQVITLRNQTHDRSAERHIA